MLVSTLRTTTLTPATAAPLGSVTRPRMVPRVVWAGAATARRLAARSVVTAFMAGPPQWRGGYISGAGDTSERLSRSRDFPPPPRVVHPVLRHLASAACQALDPFAP